MSAVVTESSIAYGEPPSYTSRDFTEVQRTYTTSNPDYWYKSGANGVRISLNNLGQNEFVDTNRMNLEFGIISVMKAPPVTVPPTPPPPTTNAYPATYSVDAAAVFPGAPAFGCPFISRATVSVPGLALDQFLTRDEESQTIIASRLLCSSGVGEFSESIGPCDFHISGKPELAGARSIADRLKCLTSTGVYVDAARTVVNAAGNPTDPTPASVFTCRGHIIDYVVPVSLLSPLMNSPSARLPIAYLAQGGDLLTFDFQLASPQSALCYPTIAELAAGADYYMVTPRISLSVLQINSQPILAAIEALYRGVSSVNVTPSMSLSSVLVYKTINYNVGYTTIPANSGSFQLTIPCNQPSCRGVMLKFVPDGYVGYGLRDVAGAFSRFDAVKGTQWNGKYAFGVKPILDSLQLRCGSFRVPLDPMTDSVTAGKPPGLDASPFTDATGAPIAGDTNAVPNTISSRHQARLYSTAKHLFSPFAVEEDPHQDALSKFHSGGSSLPIDNAASGLFGSPRVLAPTFGAVANPLTSAIFNPAIANTFVSGGGDNEYPISYAADPCLYFFPFETAAAVYNHRSDAFACRGLDLRNITSLTISARVLGVDSLQPPGKVIEGTAPTVGGWKIYAMMAFDQMMVVLPGRTDTAAQFSLLSAGATSVPTGGNPAM